MVKQVPFKIITLVFISAAVIAVDQIVKLLFLSFWRDHLVYNLGIAFGIKLPVWLVLLTFILIVGVGIWSWYKDPSHSERGAVGLALILGGALSNILDRATQGAVLDYIDLKIWPVFNLADTAIFIGVVLLLWYALVSSNTSHAKHKGEENKLLKKKSRKNS